MHLLLNGQALTLSGIPNKAGNYTVSVNGTNLWGMTEGNLTVIVDSILPEIQTLKPTQVGSTSANLQANLLETGGAENPVPF